MSETATTFTAAQVREMADWLQDFGMACHDDADTRIETAFTALRAYAARLEQDEHEARHGGPLVGWQPSHVIHVADPKCAIDGSHPRADCGIHRPQTAVTESPFRP